LTTIRVEAKQRTPRVIIDEPTPSDRWFNRATSSAGLIVLVLLALVGFFLFWQSREAFSTAGLSFFTTDAWSTQADPPQLGVLGMLTGTVLVSLVAIVIAIPLAVCAALFIVEYASNRARSWLGATVDLLAAVPSLLFGMWGYIFLGPQLVPVAQWLTRYFGWIPLFATQEGKSFLGSIFIAGVVVALMCLPIIASISREVFGQVPVGEKEAALALGSTRSGMIRAVVLPYGRGGIIGGSMLGLGRALGETIAVALILPQTPQVVTQILQSGGSTISGFIALNGGAAALNTSGLMAAGLVLFLLTFATNVVASFVVSRSRSGAGVEL
jgi:phosphate transport system permease protein